MPSKNSDKSKGPKRSKSTLSVRSTKRCRPELADPQQFDPVVAHHHAVIAGCKALKLSSETNRESASSKSLQSVRYTGPKRNALLVPRSITRRYVPELNATNNNCDYGSSHSTCTTQEASGLLTALPTIPSPRKSCSRNKLRKKRSLKTTKSQSSLQTRAQGSEYSESQDCQVRIEDDSRSLPFRPLQSSCSSESRYYDNQSLLIARTITPKQSLQSLLGNCKRGFSVRKGSRTSNSSKKPWPDKASLTIKNIKDVPNLGIKKRLTSIKRGVQNILRLRSRSSCSNQSVPSQHIEASRAYFTKVERENDGEDDENPLLGLANEKRSNENVWARGNESFENDTGRESDEAWMSEKRLSAEDQRIPSQGTVVTNCASDSRVTSWADSSVNDELPYQGMTRQASKKRLSVIQENGAPYQPSMPDICGAFSMPIPRTSSGRTAEPVDSDRVYSALQRHIDHEKVAYANPWMQSSQNSNQCRLSSLKPQEESTIRVVSCSSSTAKEVPAAAESAQSLHGKMSVVSEWTDDNVFSPRRIDQELNREREEPCSRFQTPSRRAPREARSTFFPAASGLKPKGSCPAMMSSPVGSRSRFIGFGSERDGTPGDTAESIYSRATDGTPKPLRFGDLVETEAVTGATDSVYSSTKLERELNEALLSTAGMCHWALPSPSGAQELDQYGISDEASRPKPLEPMRVEHKREQAIINTLPQTPPNRHSPERVERLKRAHSNSPRAKGPTRVSQPQQQQHQRQQGSFSYGSRVASSENVPPKARAPYLGRENPWASDKRVSKNDRHTSLHRHDEIPTYGMQPSRSSSREETAVLLRERVVSNDSVAFI